MTKPIIVIGAGGHGRVLIDALLATGAEVIGILDADADLHGTEILGVPVLGNDDALRDHPSDTVLLVNGIGSISAPDARKAVYERLKQSGYNFASVIHPSAVIARNVEMGEGAQIMAGAVVQVSVRIGDNTIINSRAAIDHDCGLGGHVHVAPGATVSGGVRIGAMTHIGCGATVIQNVRIGEGCLVAAGAVVVENIADGKTVSGTPARTAP